MIRYITHLHHPTVFRPKRDISRSPYPRLIFSHAAQEWTMLTFEDEATHSDRIIDIPLPLQHIHQVSNG